MQTIYRMSLLFLGLLFCLIPTAFAQDECPSAQWRIDGDCQSLDNLSLSASEWHSIDPGGDTRCAHDTEYRFWIHPGNDNLLVFFQGGGGCWDEASCRAGSGFYKESVGSNEPQFSYRQGIFDFDNPDNPFTDYTMIFVPSCTGDVYMGNGLVEYSDDVVIQHRGYANLKSAVDFAIQAMPEPESVFVTGCSAGSVGSSIAAPYFIDAYPDTLVTQLGDSLALIFDTPADMPALWKTTDFYTDALANANPPDLTAYTQAEYYMALGRAYPDHIFAQYNFQFDNVQQRYFAIGEADPRAFVGENIPANMAMIAAETPNFRYYIGNGSSHCIMPTPYLYTVEVDSVPVLDWVWAVAQGQEVENHQ